MLDVAQGHLFGTVFEAILYGSCHISASRHTNFFHERSVIPSDFKSIRERSTAHFLALSCFRHIFHAFRHMPFRVR
jgi:hypothetical protein